jgi:DNA-binding GntR family transcriptional regulator
MKLNRHSSLFKEGRIEQSLAEHRAIVQALADHQPEVAAERMSDHFMSGLQAAQ